MRIKLTINSISCIILASMILHSMSLFSPKFKDSNIETSLTEVGADTTSRLIWFFLSALSIIVITYRSSLVLRMLKASWPLWMLMLIATTSILWSSQPLVAFTRLSQQYILILCSIACAAGIQRKSSFINSLLAAISVVISFDLVLFASSRGWTDLGFAGFHGHKNTSGFIFATAILVFYAAALYERSWRKLFYLGMIAPTGVLLYFSNSKTSTILCLTIIALHLPLYIRRSLEPKKFGRYWLIGVLTAFLVMTTVIFAYLQKSGITFTGRLDIWQFIFDKLKSHWLLGYGYASFWAVGNSSLNVQYGGYYAGFITQLNQAHNSYLDIILTLGILGFISIWLFLFSLAGKLEKYHEQTGSDVLVCLFSLILGFALSHSLLESTILRGYNPMWMMILLMYSFLVVKLEVRKTKND